MKKMVFWGALVVTLFGRVGLCQENDICKAIKRAWVSNQDALLKTPFVVEFSIVSQSAGYDRPDAAETGERLSLRFHDIDGSEPTVEWLCEWMQSDRLSFRFLRKQEKENEGSSIRTDTTRYLKGRPASAIYVQDGVSWSKISDRLWQKRMHPREIELMHRVSRDYRELNPYSWMFPRTGGVPQLSLEGETFTDSDGQGRRSNVTLMMDEAWREPDTVKVREVYAPWTDEGRASESVLADYVVDKATLFPVHVIVYGQDLPMYETRVHKWTSLEGVVFPAEATWFDWTPVVESEGKAVVTRINRLRVTRLSRFAFKGDELKPPIHPAARIRDRDTGKEYIDLEALQKEIERSLALTK
jgi:hypothetical protein